VTGSAGTILIPKMVIAGQSSGLQSKEKPETNIKNLEKYPRNENSIPGKYPGKVVKVYHENCMADNKPDLKAAKKMQNEGMLRLTGKKNIKKAWRQLWRVSTMKTPCPIW